MMEFWKDKSKSRIDRVPRLTDKQIRTLFHWEHDVFAGDHLSLEWAPDKDQHFLAYEQGKLVGHAGLITVAVSAGDTSLTVGGLSGLITLPAVRGKGYSKKLVGEFIDFSREHTSADFTLLFCQDALEAYYQKLGFQKLPGPVTIQQATGPIICPINSYYFPLRDTGWPEGPVTVHSLPW